MHILENQLFKVKILIHMSRVKSNEEENIIVLFCHNKYFLLFFTDDPYRMSNSIYCKHVLVDEISSEKYENILQYEKIGYKIKTPKEKYLEYICDNDNVLLCNKCMGYDHKNNLLLFINNDMFTEI